MTVHELGDLFRLPVVVAPMAGGPSNPALAATAAQAGAIGFLAAGYKTASTVVAEIAEVRAATAGPFATRALRSAAAKGGDTERMSLWAGQGFRSATDRPAAEVIEMLAR